jgi:putative oxidoreductase
VIVVSFLPEQALHGARPVVQGVFRLVTGFLFACHGVASLFGVMGGAHGGGTIPAMEWPAWWAALIQMVGGILVGLGLFTQPMAIVCSGSMAYAYFSVHQSNGLLPIINGGEPAVMFCWTFLLIAFIGPGAFAIQTFFTKAPGAVSARAGESAPVAAP